MLVTKDVNIPGASVLDYLKAHSSTLKTGHIYGGTAAVSAAAEDQMAKAAQTAPASATSRPELVSAAITDTNTTGELGTDGTTVRFTFDEAIANATTGTAPTPGKFYVYDKDGFVDGGDDLIEVSGNTVTVRFRSVTADLDAAALTVGTVDFEAVFDDSGAGSPEGDAPLNSTTGGTTVTLPAGTTVAPDLVSIGGFAANATTGTDVEFVFDEAADVLVDTAFSLIGTDGDPIASDGITGGDGTKTIIVHFPGTIAKADIARGVAGAGAVEEHADNEGDTTQDANTMQAADVSNGGNSADPDLVSIELREGSATAGDQVLYTFDENIASARPGGFHLYYQDGSAAADGSDYTINSANPRQVLVDFDEDAIDGAVGGQVDPFDGTTPGTSAVTGTDGNDNEADEVGVANTGTTSGQTAGRTNGPDLTKVTVAQTKDGFGNVTGATATYTFDEALSAAGGSFYIYLADGTQLTATTCDVDDNGTTGTATDDTSVTCDFVTVPVAAAASGVLGTVDDHAVTALTGTPNYNPEGAERVS